MSAETTAEHEIEAVASGDSILVTVDARHSILLKSYYADDVPQALRRRLPTRLSPLYVGGVDRVTVRLIASSVTGARTFAITFRAGARR